MPLSRTRRLQYRQTMRVLIYSIISVAGISILFAGYSVLSYSHPRYPVAPSTHTVHKPVPWDRERQQKDLRITKATVLYDGESKLYGKVVNLHARHGGKGWGYHMHVLRSRIVKGALNKPLWLQELITSELRKPVEKRVEWILYFDPSVLLQNLKVPLHDFLPPITNVEHFKTLSIIAAKPDGNHLSTSVFFIRVSAVSLRILTEAMAAMYDGPPDDNNANVLATALQAVLEKDKNREHALFQLASWYNGSTSLFQQPYFRTPAHRMLFLEDVSLASFPSTRKYQNTFPDKEAVDAFWQSVTEARRVLDEVKEIGQTADQGEWREMVRDVRDCVELRAWDTEEVLKRVNVLKDKLQIE